MGSYTRCHYRLKLRADTPDVVKRYIHLLANDESDDWADTKALRGQLILNFNHALFHTDHWYSLFCDFIHNDRDYEDETHINVTQDSEGAVLIDVISMVKNYESVVAKFVGFLHPYLSKDFDNLVYLVPEDRLPYDDQFRHPAFIILGDPGEKHISKSGYKYTEDLGRIARWRWTCPRSLMR